MNHNHQIYRDRRAALLAQMRAQTGGGLALVPTAPEVARNRDSLFPYRHDSYFYYLSGFPEPGGGDRARRRAPTATGRSCSAARRTRSARSGTASATAPTPRARSSASTRRIRSPSSTRCSPDLAADQPALYTPLGLFAAWDKTDHRRCSTKCAAARAPASARRRRSSTCAQALDALRLVKDAHELALMRRAAAISSGAHRRAMERTRPGWYEYQVEAELAHEFLRDGAQAVAYPSIVAGGPNACVLHYRDNNRQLQDGELLLIDAGCEYQSYASDITRTFPVNGRFTRPAEGRLRARARGAAGVHRCGEARRRIPRLPQDRRARARAGLHRPRTVQGHARRGAGSRAATSSSTCTAPVTGSASTCTTPASTRCKGASQKLVARHGADRRARHLHPPRGQRARGVLGHRRAHRGRRAGHRDRQREPDRRGAEIASPTSRPRAGAERAARRDRLLHDVVIVGAGPGRRDARARARRRRPRRRRARRARAGRDAARRPLARAVARRAAHPRAARRRGAALAACRRGHADHDDRRLAGGRLRRLRGCRPPSTGCRRSATSSAIARCRRRSTPRSRASASQVRHGVDGDSRRRHAGVCGGRAAEAREPLLARLAAVADGTGAVVAGVARQRHDYGQVALVARVLRAAPHGGVAFERFTPQGRSRCCRRAIITVSCGPRRRNARRRCSRCRTRRSSRELARHFGPRAGGFTQRRRSAHVSAGARIRAIAGRHALALRSATPRRRCIRSPGRASTSACATRTSSRESFSTRRATTSASRAMLDRYRARRRIDRMAGIAFTHGLVASSATTSRCCAGRAGWRSLCSTRFRR